MSSADLLRVLCPIIQVIKEGAKQLDQLPSRCPAVLESLGCMNIAWQQQWAREVDEKPERHGSGNRSIQNISRYRLSKGLDIWAISSLDVPGCVG